MKSMYELVRECHEAFEHPVDSIDPHGDDQAWAEYLEFRFKLIDEEVQEFKDGLIAKDLENVMKERCDVGVVMEGTLVGIKGIGSSTDGPFQDVHKANMSKLDDNGKPIKNEWGKFMKSKNYRPADLSKYVN